MPSVEGSIKSSIRTSVSKLLESNHEIPNGNLGFGFSLDNPYYQGPNLTLQLIFGFRLLEKAQAVNLNNFLYLLIGDGDLHIYNAAIEKNIAITNIDKYYGELLEAVTLKSNHWWNSNNKYIAQALIKCYDFNYSELVNIFDRPTPSEQQITELNVLLENKAIKVKFFTWLQWLDFAKTNIHPETLELLQTAHQQALEHNEEYKNAFRKSAIQFTHRKYKHIESQLSDHELPNKAALEPSQKFIASYWYLITEANPIVSYARALNCTCMLYAGPITEALIQTQKLAQKLLKLPFAWIDTSNIKTAKHTNNFKSESSIFKNNIIRISQSFNFNNPLQKALFYKLLSLLLHISLYNQQKTRYTHLKISDLTENLKSLIRNLDKLTWPLSDNNLLVPSPPLTPRKLNEQEILIDDVKIQNEFDTVTKQLTQQNINPIIGLKKSVSYDKTSLTPQSAFFKPKHQTSHNDPTLWLTQRNNQALTTGYSTPQVSRRFLKESHALDAASNVGVQTLAIDDVNSTTTSEAVTTNLRHNKLYLLLIDLVNKEIAAEEGKIKITDEKSKFSQKLNSFYDNINNPQIATNTLAITIKDTISVIDILNNQQTSTLLLELIDKLLNMFSPTNTNNVKANVERMVNNTFRKFIVGTKAEKRIFLFNLAKELAIAALIDNNSKDIVLNRLITAIESNSTKRKRNNDRLLLQQLNETFNIFVTTSDNTLRNELIIKLCHTIQKNYPQDNLALHDLIAKSFGTFNLDDIDTKIDLLQRKVCETFQTIDSIAFSEEHKMKLKHDLEALTHELVSPWHFLSDAIENTGNFFNKTNPEHLALFAKLLAFILFRSTAKSLSQNLSHTDTYIKNYLSQIALSLRQSQNSVEVEAESETQPEAQPKTKRKLSSSLPESNVDVIIMPSDKTISDLLNACADCEESKIAAPTKARIAAIKQQKSILSTLLFDHFNSLENNIRSQELLVIAIQQALSGIFLNDKDNKAKFLRNLAHEIDALLENKFKMIDHHTHAGSIFTKSERAQSEGTTIDTKPLQNFNKTDAKTIIPTFTALRHKKG